MSNEVSFGIRFTATGGQQVAADIANQTTAFDKLNVSAQRMRDTIRAQNEETVRYHRMMRGSVAEQENSSAAAAKLIDRYDQQGARLRKLKSDFDGLNKAMLAGNVGTADDSRYLAAMRNIKREMEVAGRGAEKLGLNTQYARQEMMMLGREALSGDFSRMPQTFGSLVAHSNLLQAAMTPLGLAIGGTAVVVGASAVAYAQGAAEMKAMNNAIMYTGDYAGTTRGQMIGLSAEISRTSTLTIGVAKDVVTQLVNSGRIGEQSLGEIARMADTYAAATGSNIDQVGADLAKLFDNPVKGAAELNSRMHFLNATELEYIDHLVKIGEEEQARLELAEKFNQGVPKHVENVGLMESAWNKASKAASFFWESAKGIGRENTPEENLQRYIDRIAANNAAGKEIPEWVIKGYTEVVAQMSKEAEAAAAQEKAARAEERRIKDVSLARSLSSSARIKDIDAEMLRLNELASIETSSAEQRMWAIEAIGRKQKELDDLLNPKHKTDPNDIAVTALHTDLFRKQMEAMGVSAEQVKVYEMAMKGATATQLKQAQAIVDTIAPINAEIEAREAAHKELDATFKARQASMTALGKESEALYKKLEADKFALSIIGKGKDEIALLSSLRGEDALQMKIQEAAQLELTGSDEARLFILREQIKTMLELRAVGADTAAAIATDEAIKQQAKDWEKFTDGIERNLTDSLQRGFENGKPFVKNFFNSLEATAKTTILKVGVQWVASPIMGGINGAHSAYGNASGGNGAMDYVSAGNTIWNGFSGGMATSMGSMAMSAGQMFGSAALTEFGVGATYAGAGGTIAGAAASSTAAGIGASVATAMPYIAAAYAAYSMFAGNGGTPTASTGHAVIDYDAAGNQTGYQSQYGVSNAETDATVAGMQASYMGWANKLGIGTVDASFGYAGNTGKDGQAPQFGLHGSAGGVTFRQDETAYSDAAMGEAASRAVFAALQGSKLPEYLKVVFDGLDASKTSGQDISDTLAFAGALRQIHDGFEIAQNPAEFFGKRISELGHQLGVSVTDAGQLKTALRDAIEAGKVTPVTLAAWQELGTAIDKSAAYAGTLKQVRDGLADTSRSDIQASDAFINSIRSMRNSLLGAAPQISAAQKQLDEIGATAATFTRDFLTALDEGMSQDKLARWQAAGQALGQLGDMSLTVGAAVPQLTQTTWEMWRTQTDSVRGLISTYDGSVAATYALSAATRDRYATEQQLVDQISAAMNQLPDMFANSAEQMRLSVMSTQEKSNYFVDRANALEAQIMSATDPAKIEELARKYNDAANNAWNNLDEVQRKSNIDQYTRNLDEINTITTEKLGKSLNEIITTSGAELPLLIAQAVKDAMTAFVESQKVVATMMQGAADTMQAAADTPVQVDVGVEFTANVPGDSQVSVVQP